MLPILRGIDLYASENAFFDAPQSRLTAAFSTEVPAPRARHLAPRVRAKQNPVWLPDEIVNKFRPTP
jgi:hypothetical protein